MDRFQFDAIEIGRSILARPHDSTMGTHPVSDGDVPSLQDVLDALDDPDCRTILRETVDPMTAKELTETCDIPTSTVYRKLDLLSSASLVRERIEINPDGGRITRYQCDVDDVRISMADDEFDVAITRPKRSVDERLATIWSKMGDEL